MRIGFDISKALAPRDGIGSYTAHLLRALMESRPQAEVLLYSLTGRIEPRDFSEHYPESPTGFRLMSGKPTDKDALDLFHANTWAYPLGFSGRVLFTCYDLTVLSHPDFHTLENKVHSLTGLLEALAGRAHWVAISNTTRQGLLTHLGIDRARVPVIYPAPAPLFQPKSSDDAKREVEASFEISAPFVLAVGTFEPRKNLARLVAAYDRLPEELQLAHPLVLAGGEGWRNGALSRALDERQGPGEIKQLGRVSDDQLVALYSAARLFVYPSLAEGFGLPIVEAMACGAPVVTSRGGATAEAAGEAARFVDPQDIEQIALAMSELLTDGDARSALREASLARAGELSWRKTATETLALYQRLIETDICATEPAP